jgi:hypothetical protein
MPDDLRRRGGRPRRFCPAPARCKVRGDRRARTIAQLVRWQTAAVKRNDTASANRLSARIESLRTAPFTTMDRPPISQGVLHRQYLDEQRRIHVRFGTQAGR